MFLAIVGAILILDRLLSGIFNVYVPIIISVIIILYTTEYTLKDGLILSFGTFVLCLLFGSIYLLLYDVVAMIAGLLYGFLANRGADRRILLLGVSFVYIVGEFVLTIVILKLFGYGDLEESYAIIKEVASYYNVAVNEGLLALVYGLAIFFTGFLEGVLVHLLAIIILKKLKIKVIKSLSLDKLILNPIIAYAAFIFFMIMIVSLNYHINTALTYLIICLGLLSFVVLLVQGYIFLLVYGMIVYGKNLTWILILGIILLMPLSFFVLALLGFLYASGPLKRYLDKKRGMRNE